MVHTFVIFITILFLLFFINTCCVLWYLFVSLPVFCIFVSLYVCFFVCLFLCVFVSLYVCFFVCLFLYMFLYICFLFVSLYVCMFVSLFVSFHVTTTVRLKRRSMDRLSETDIYFNFFSSHFNDKRILFVDTKKLFFCFTWCFSVD